MVVAPDMRAGMCDAVVDAAASAEAGESFVQLMAEVGVRHWQLRSARLCLPAPFHDSLQPRSHRICRQGMLLGCFTLTTEFHLGLRYSIQKQHATRRTRKCPGALQAGLKQWQ